MRQLWHDIDHAKHKAGLGPAPEPPPAPAWDLPGMIERATMLASDAAAWMTSNVPVAVALLATGAELLRQVPVVGRLVDLVPTLPAPHAPQLPPRPEANGHAHANGRILQLDPDGDDEPDGKWIH